MNQEETGRETPYGDNGKGTAQRFAEQGRKARDEVQELRSTMENVTNEARDVLLEQLEARPYVVLGAAAGLGWVLGASLPKAGGMLTRIAVNLAVARVVGGIAQGGISGFGGQSGEPGAQEEEHGSRKSYGTQGAGGRRSGVGTTGGGTTGVGATGVGATGSRPSRPGGVGTPGTMGDTNVPGRSTESGIGSSGTGVPPIPPRKPGEDL